MRRRGRERAGAIAIAVGLGVGGLLTAGSGGPARAETVGAIALAPPRGPVAPDALGRALQQAAAGAGDRVVIDPVARAAGAIAAGAVTTEALARFARVGEVATEGWRAYLKVAAEYAAARLGAARRDAEDLLALDGGVELYADVSLRLGAVLGELGQRAASAEAFRLAAALDPGRAVTTAEFSPDVVAAFDAARAVQVASAPVTVRSEAGATIELDGRPAGAQPARAQLAIGPHVAVARAPGHRARGVAFQVPAEGTTIDLALDPDGAPGAVEVGAASDDAAAAIDAAIVYGEVDGVVLAAVVPRGGGTSLLGQWCAGAPVRCTPVVEVAFGEGELGAAATRIWGTLRDARTAARYPPTLPRDSRLAAGGAHGGGCRVCRSPWLWGGVGAAIVVGVTTAIVVGGGGTRQPTVTIDPSTFTH